MFAATIGHTLLQESARREGTLVASRRQKWTSRIGTIGISDGHLRQDRGGNREEAIDGNMVQNSYRTKYSCYGNS